ncbi:hypothetical protein CBS101457_004503 [Exobasidium rhododendri]|nr:hypothetical protein CBS101457_004503 [Exobasidium rhododendri]
MESSAECSTVGSEVRPKHKHTVGQDEAGVEDALLQNRRVAGPFILNKCEKEAARNWDLFYKHHEDRFFKNKNWTDREFAELGKGKDVESAALTDDVVIGENILEGKDDVLLEVGCGPGNMLYPVINRNTSIKAHCCDFSARAIDLLKANPQFDMNRINPFVFDLVKNEPNLSSVIAPHPFGPPSIVSLIFVLSAIPPKHHRDVFATLCETLPLLGTFCFRDFAHGDLSQIRFHKKASAAWCEPNLLSEEQDFYRRGDNTFTYYFNLEEINAHAKSVGLEGEVNIKEIHGLNRKTGVQLHRRFIQGRWKKVR